MSKQEIKIPDIGGTTGADVIEIFVAPGDSVKKEDSLITLETEKATMEIPAPSDGVIAELKVKIGDKVSEGDVILMLEGAATEAPEKETKPKPTPAPAAAPAPAASPAPKAAAPQPAAEKQVAAPEKDGLTSKGVHAGPGVRRFARELGVELDSVVGTGRKGRIVQEDVQSYVKSRLQGDSAKSGGLAVASIPQIDFSKYGDIELQPLHKIKKFTAKNVHASWLTVPHVTQFDEADITELEDFRQSRKKEAEKEGVKLTPLAFIMKAAVKTLEDFPEFNSSLDASGEHLIIKKYFHIGVAVETPNGLMVPVIRDVDKKGVFELAGELAAISAKAREKGLSPADMEGSTFTISSLGGIGGTAFTPIVKAPDVAILGVSRSQIKPVYQDNKFVPRLMLPLALSYDHRVIDGAQGARFSRQLAGNLGDIRRLLL